MLIGLTMPTRPELAARVCSGCGGILDAPRPDPHSGAAGRKCAGCGVWYPLELGIESIAEEPALGLERGAGREAREVALVG